MQYVGSLVAVGAVVLVAGCNSGGPRWGGVIKPQQPAAAQLAPTAPALVGYLNTNSQRLQSIEVGELDLDCKVQSQAFGLRGHLVCQKSRNFRLAAKMLGSQEVDLGSNDREFWYWIKRGEPPYQFFCSHDDFKTGNVRAGFPFQPDWVMEALGMGEYGPPEDYQVRVDKERVFLYRAVRTPQGKLVYKVTQFNNSGRGVQVPLHQLQDEAGKEICSAHVLEVQALDGGVVVPRRVKLVWKAENVELTMKLGDVAVNRQIPQERVAMLFNRPNMANVQAFDLARGVASPTGNVRRVRGTFR
jgi:hypothetical protein